MRVGYLYHPCSEEGQSVNCAMQSTTVCWVQVCSGGLHMGAVWAHICGDALASHSRCDSELRQHKHRSEDSGSICATGASDMRPGVCGGVCHLAQANGCNIPMEGVPGKAHIACQSAPQAIMVICRHAYTCDHVHMPIQHVQVCFGRFHH